MANMKFGIRTVPGQPTLLDFINDIEAGFRGDYRPIVGGITITGHDYWVILEYGSSPAELDPGPKDSDPIILRTPTLPAPKHWSEEYPINARRKKWLYFYDAKAGYHRFALGVRHPGVKARGFLRRTIGALEPQFTKQLKQLVAEEIPTRRKLVTFVNSYLSILLQSIRDATPVGSDEDGFEYDENDGKRLRDAWTLEKAT